MSKHNYYRHLNRIVRYQPIIWNTPGIDQTVKTVKFSDLKKAVKSNWLLQEEMDFNKVESRDVWKPVSPRTVLSLAIERHPARRTLAKSKIEKYTCPINHETIHYKSGEKCNNSLEDLWRKKKRNQPVSLRPSLIGYRGGDEFKMLETNGVETCFQMGSHSGIVFNPDQNHQMIIMAKGDESRLFVEGAQDTHIVTQLPSPSSHLLAGEFHLRRHGYSTSPAKGSMVAMISRHANMLYTNFGVNYQCLVSRNGQIIYQTQPRDDARHKGCVRVKRGDVVFIGSIKCFNVVRAEEIALWSGFLCGRRSIAQFCHAAVAETTLRIGEVIRERLFDGANDVNYEPNMVCSVGVIS